MSAKKYIRDHGLHSVIYVAKRAGISRALLHKWFHTRPLVFRLLVIGCRDEDSNKSFNVKILQSENERLSDRVKFLETILEEDAVIKAKEDDERIFGNGQ